MRLDVEFDSATNAASFSLAAVRAKPALTALASKLLRRWRAPSSVSADDLVQELLLGMWAAIPNVDRERGSAGRFLVWEGTVAAKRWLHRQRGVSIHGNPDKSRSRFDSVTETGELDLEVSAAQEEVIAALERVLVAVNSIPPGKTRFALEAFIVTGSVDGAVALATQHGVELRPKLVMRAAHMACEVLN